MSFILKTFSKKALAVVCTVALLLTVVSVCFSAIALTPAEFTVTAARPAIPAKVGKGIDLSKIDVEFSGGTQNGADITWESLDTTGGISVDDTAKTAIYLKKGIYAMKATYGTETQNVYIMEVGSNNETVLYSKAFTADDLENGVFKADSEWAAKVTNNEALGFHVYFGSGLCLPADKGNIAAAYYIKPDSAPGKMISKFSDLTVEYNAFSRGVSAFSGPLLRLNLGDNGTYEAADASVYPSIVSRNSGEEASWLRIICSGTKIDGDKDDLLADDTTGDAFHYTREGIWYNVRATIEGTALKLKYTSPTQTASYNVPQAVTVTAGGTVGVKAEEIRNASLRDFKVLVSFTADEVAGIDDYLFDVNMISADKPIIPAKVNTLYNLGEIFFAMSNGNLAKGSELTWTTADSNILLDGAKVAVLGEGMAKLIGTDAASNTTTLYVTTTNSNDEGLIYEHTFSAADVDTTSKNFVADSDWTLLTGGGNLVWHSLGGVQTGNIESSSYVLKPTSAAGKMVSSFRDVIVETNIAFPTSFGVHSNYSYDFTLVARANWADNSAISGSIQSYAGGGYNVPNNQSADWAKIKVSGSTAVRYNFPTYTSAINTTYNYKVSVIGDEVKIYKNGTQTPITMGTDQISAMANTKAGTIYITNLNTRLVLKDIKVSAKFAESDYLEGSRIISEVRPVLGVEKDKKYDLSNIYFVIDGALVKGSDATFATTSDIASVSGASLFTVGEGVAPITVTKDSKSITVYAMTVKDNKAVIYDHTFSAADLENGQFKADSEWTTTLTDKTIQSLHGTLVVNEAIAGAFWIKPESDAGRLISKFPNLTVEYTSKALGIQQRWSGPILRLNLGDNAAYDAADVQVFPAIYTQLSDSTEASWLRIWYNNVRQDSDRSYMLKVDGTTDKFRYSTNAYASNHDQVINFTTRATLNGTQLTLQYIANDVKNETVVSSQVVNVSQKANNTTAAGTVGFRALDDIRNAAAVSYKVIIDVADEEILSGVTFTTLDKPTADTTVFTYNGQDQTYTIADNAAYTVSGNVQKDAGTYTVTVALKDKNASVWSDGTTDDVTFDFIIGRKNVTVTADAASKEFGTTDPALTFTAEGLVGSDTLTGALTRAAGEVVGSYEIQQGTVNNDNNPNYNITFVSNTFKVTKTNQAAIEITNKPSGEIVYGDEFTLGTTGGSGTGAVSWAITAGDTFATVDAAGKVTINGVGQVTVTATKAGDNDYEPTSASYTFTSVKATPVLGQVTTTVVVTNAMLPSQVTLTKQSGPAGTLVITDSAMLADKTSYSWKFTPDDTANYNEVTGNITITVADKLYPTAQIKVDGDDATADSDISFSIIGKTEKEVTITAADEEHGSGIAAIKYAVSSTVVDVTELDSLTYTAYNGAFKVSEGKSIVYVQVTDNAGNISYYVSEGIIVDGTAPVIKDVEDGDEFDGNKVIEAQDALSGIASVKVDGDAVTVEDGKFTVIANDAERTITVTDKAGNVTEIKITLNKVYTATFKGENGVITTITLKTGETLTMPAVPTKEGYTVKWDKTVDTLTEDIVINAVYTKIEAEKEPEKEEDKKPDSPKTGDITNLWFWVVVLAVSGAALIVSFKAKKVR